MVKGFPHFSNVYIGSSALIAEDRQMGNSFYLRRSTQVYKWHRKSGRLGKEGPKSSEIGKEGPKLSEMGKEIQ